MPGGPLDALGAGTIVIAQRQVARRSEVTPNQKPHATVSSEQRAMKFINE